MSNEVWLVTGSSRGLGFSVVERALSAGKRVVATARDTSSLAVLREKYGDRLRTMRLDVTHPEQAEEVVSKTVAAFGQLDVVVNNAGYADIAPIESTDLASFRAQIDANFYGTVFVTKAALPLFREQGSGLFIQVTSVGGRLTAPGLGAYQSAKFAVEGFSSVLRQEVSPLGIRVVLAEPGSMRTDWAGDSMQVPEVDPAYDSTVGAMARRTRSSSGMQPIDPDAVARVFVDLSTHPSPPLHLLLGSDAVDFMADALRTTAAEDREWADVGRSVDFGSSH